MRCVLQHCCTSINEEHWTGIAKQVSETLLFAQVSGPDVCRALSNMHVKHIVNSGVFFHFSKAEKQKSKWFSGTTTIEHFKQVVLNKAFVFFRPMINSIFRQFFLPHSARSQNMARCQNGCQMKVAHTVFVSAVSPHNQF